VLQEVSVVVKKGVAFSNLVVSGFHALLVVDLVGLRDTDSMRSADIAGPASRRSDLGGLGDGLALLQNGDIFPSMALPGGNETNTAMVMLLVIPVDEARPPLACLLQVHEGLFGESREYLQVLNGASA
jgi:hypothetical protein